MLIPSALYPPPLRPWLALRGSMTRQLEDTFNEAPRVVVRYEGPRAPEPWERRLLRTPARALYAREVTLCVADKAVLHARTLASLRHPAVGTLKGLQRQPLAQLLFQDPRWRRIGAAVPLRAPIAGSVRYGRACLWHFGPRQRELLLVEEFFADVLNEHRP